MKVTNWLRDNRDRLSLRAIEQELGIPSTTLSKAVSGQQMLPKKWVEPLTKLREQLCTDN